MTGGEARGSFVDMRHSLAALGLLAATLALLWLAELLPPQGEGGGRGSLDPAGSASDPHVDPGPEPLPRVAAEPGERAAPAALDTTADAPRQGWVRGSCVEHLNLAPLAGIELRFLAGDEVIATTRSEADGAFALEIPTEFARIELAPGQGRWLVEREERGDEHLLRLAPRDLGPFRGRLVDAATDEPLPDYVVELVDARGWRRTLCSDGRGRLELSGLFARGPIEFRGCAEELGPERARRLLAVHEHRPAGASPPSVSIALPSGPTYRLRLEMPPGLTPTDLRASIAPRSWTLERVADYAETFPLRAGDPPWVRFPLEVVRAQEAQLVVTDAARRWSGQSPVEAGPGLHPSPVPLRLERRAYLRGRVVDDSGEAVPRAQVELARVGDSTSDGPRRTDSNGLGTFHFEGLEAGRYELFARHRRSGLGRLALEVGTETSEPVVLRLEAHDLAGDVAGLARSLSGSFRGPVLIELLPLGSTAELVPRRRLRPRWEEHGGAWEAPFRFEGVPRGRYELRSTAEEVEFVVEPRARELSPPAEGLDLLVRDDLPRYRLGLLVVDADSGRWIHGAQLRIVDAAGELAFEGTATHWGPPRRFADGEDFSWVLEHPGHVSQSGDRAAFDRRTTGHAHFAIFRLERE